MECISPERPFVVVTAKHIRLGEGAAVAEPFQMRVQGFVPVLETNRGHRQQSKRVHGAHQQPGFVEFVYATLGTNWLNVKFSSEICPSPYMSNHLWTFLIDLILKPAGL